MITKQKRPKYLNLFKIHLPVAGVNSFAHRVSGALLILATPLLIYLFGLSLRSAEGFQTAAVLVNGVCGKLVLTMLAWAIGHHLLAGIRFLLIDVDIGGQLSTASKSAWAVNVAGVLVFLLIAYKIWI